MNKRALVFIITSGVMGGLTLPTANADSVDFNATILVTKGTCTFSAAKLTFDFGNVTPQMVSQGTVFRENPFTVSNCVGTSALDIKLSSTKTINIASGDYIGKWVVPTSNSVSGVAFKTDFAVGGNGYKTFPADNTTTINITGAGSTTPVNLKMKATLVPTVANFNSMVAGDLAGTATINVSYP
jgi:hypothetical protein